MFLKKLSVFWSKGGSCVILQPLAGLVLQPGPISLLSSMAFPCLTQLMSDIKVAGEFKLSHGSLAGLTPNDVSLHARDSFLTAAKGKGGKTSSAKILQAYARLALAAEDLNVALRHLETAGPPLEANSVLGALVVMDHTSHRDPLLASTSPCSEVVAPTPSLTYQRPSLSDSWGAWTQLARWASLLRWIIWWPYLVFAFLLCRPRLLQVLLRHCCVRIGGIVGHTVFTGVSSLADGLENACRAALLVATLHRQ